jgi:hypothetical protein
VLLIQLKQRTGASGQKSRMRTARLQKSRLFVAILYGLVMALLPLAHQGSNLSRPDSIELAAYALPDGSIPLLCKAVGTNSDRAVDKSACPACTLLSLAGLLVPLQKCTTGEILTAATELPCPDHRAPVTGAHNSARPRAPPSA